MTCPCQLQRHLGAYEDEKTPARGLKVLAWFVGGVGFLFWLAHQADEYPKRRRS